MSVLAIDTAAGFCAAAVLDADATEIARRVEAMERGHAERLMPLVDEVLDASGIAYAGLTMIAVSVGPGSFTGVRVGVAAARGLALALKRPAVGVSTLEALAAEAGRAVVAAIDARRGEIYLQRFTADGAPADEPRVMALEDAGSLVAAGDAACGSGAPLLAARFGCEPVAPLGATADIPTFGRIALRRGAGAGRPVPLYLRQADAKPQQGFALPLRSAP